MTNGSTAPSGETSTRLVTPQLVIGLLLLVCGGALLLDNFGVLDAWRIIRLWPAGLILLGLSMLLQARRPAGRFAGGFWALIGLWLLLGNLDVLRLNVFDLWPIPLVLIGSYLIWQALQGPTATGGREGENMFSALAVMAGVTRKVASADFRGGEATAVMGGCKIDMRDATIAGDEAVIDLFAFWGGIELIVPQGWVVVNRIVPLLGGADDRTAPTANPAPKRLVLRGVCVMGGVEIKHGKRRDPDDL